MKMVDGRQVLSELDTQIKICLLCKLNETRKHAVPGEGSSAAEIMFVGEAPGEQEDLQGRPFVGAAGRFLNELLADIGLRRADVYITNIVKCRPPGNRDPFQEEIESCNDYLLAQIATITPRVVCTLGRFAMGLLINDKLKISGVHGRAFQKSGILYVPMYHPAAALHNEALRSEVVDDFRSLARILRSETVDG